MNLKGTGIAEIRCEAVPQAVDHARIRQAEFSPNQLELFRRPIACHLPPSTDGGEHVITTNMVLQPFPRFQVEVGWDA
jgi:hypothetical protein